MQPAAKAFSFADGQCIDHAIHDTVRDVEIGPALLLFRMAPVAGRSASVETERSRRNLVDGLAECISRQEAQLARKTLLDLGLQ